MYKSEPKVRRVEDTTDEMQDKHSSQLPHDTPKEANLAKEDDNQNEEPNYINIQALVNKIKKNLYYFS